MTDENRTENELFRILSLAWRRKWVILVPFVVVGVAVSLWGLYIPNLYLSSSSIFIEPQKVPIEYVRSTVTSDMESRLRTIRQQLTNRTKLLKVIKDLDLYPEAEAQGLPNEVLVGMMRKDLSVDIPVNRDQSFFTVSFLHREPSKAMLAITSLVSLFIEESLLVREQQAAGTTLFIEEELAALKEILEKQEADVQNFKSLHMGELPGQLDANLRMLDNLQSQLTDNLESQREVENRVVLLEQEVTRMQEDIRSVISPGGSSGPGNPSLSQLIEQRDFLSQEIMVMESKFTARHPDLLRAKKELVSVEKQIQAAAAAPQGKSPALNMEASTGATGELGNLQRQLKNQLLQLDSLNQEEKELRNRLRRYQVRVEATPNREQQLLKLNRDYENTKENYEELLNKKLEAQLSENLEKRQKGEKFQILDPANLPERPHLPNRTRIMAAGMLGGLGLGLGLAFLLEALFPVFHSVTEVKNYTNLPIVIGIPLLRSAAEKKRGRMIMGATVVGGVLLTLLLLVVVNQFLFDLEAFGQVITRNLRSMF
jgi:polysaccharide chain length determinant protein (PEP-CTERM system associated)